MRELVHIFRDRKQHITLNTQLTVTSVFNSGDISGILCTIKNDKDDVMACALTHLIFPPGLPPYDEIISYQKNVQNESGN